MKTIEVKTSELEGAALDWAVAKTVGRKTRLYLCPVTDNYRVAATILDGDIEDAWMPSLSWSQGGPLIENSRLYVAPDAGGYWWALTPCRGGHEFGHAPLIAACRAIVAAKLGDTVQVPADLIGGAA